MKNRKLKDEVLAANQNLNENKTASYSRKLRRIYLLVGFISMLVTVTLWYALNTSTRIAKQYAPQVSAAHHIKIEVVFAHLWFEEYIGGDRHKNINEVWGHLDQAEWFARAMVEGGQSHHDTYIPLNDPILRQDILDVLENIRAFRNIAEERYASIDQSYIGSDIDQRLDEVFDSFLKQADIVETSLQQTMTRDIQRFRSVQFALIVLCFLLTGIIAAVLHRFERTRSINMAMLNTANQQLRASEQQLQANNQQLMASEQQLKASNLQLRAHEQQLNATNQQLRASEQQLKAANQQLRASEQQLKATNQQLSANEQQLKASNQQLRASEQELRKASHKLEERVKELQCMYGVTESIQKRSSLEEVFQDTAELIPPGWHYPEITRGKVVFDGKEYVSDPFEETKWKQSSNIIVDGHSRGSIEVYYMEECPELDEGPFMTEERNLIDGMARNISDAILRKKVEEEIERVANQLHTSIEQMPIAYILWDSEKKVMEWNKAAETIFGYSSEEILGKPFFELIVPDAAKHTVDNVAAELFSGKPSSYSVKDNNVRKDGQLISCLWHNTPIQDEEGKIISVLSMAQDITETNRLRELSSRAERLETAGEIAGQVAHDFNNLLGPMIAYPDFLKSELSEDHSAIQMLNDIEKAATTMADINQQLLTLSRRGHFEMKTLSLNNVVTQSLNQIASQPDTLHIEMDLEKDLMNIKGGPAQLSRIISNLINNSLDAMQSVGHLFIKTENYYADDVSGKYGRISKGEYVKLTITDTGHGITKEALPKIFDPFFTTKKTDKQRGSGLGLSVVHAVMEDHNGYIDLQSEFGKGTSFFLYFPITRDEIETSDSGEIVGGAESILVIDDDTLQREVALNLLNKLGYNATAVNSGEEAVEFLRDNPQDLLVLDMIMPGGIDGAETYKRALELNPNQKAIIVSGFAETERVGLVIKLGAGKFTRKPLTLKSISSAVRRELDKVVA